uniref:Uncharacterized protein n=1 Tax=Opuntia streptacantha TaxID=393608 RepID=A0A7C8ZTV4_OPUST
MALEARLGPPHRRPPRRRIPPTPILRRRRRLRDGVGGGCGGHRRASRPGGAGMSDWGESGYGDCECDSRCMYCEEQHGGERVGGGFAEPLWILLFCWGFDWLLF